MKINKDSKRNKYIDIPMASGDFRLTFVPKCWSETPGIRFSIHAENGKVFPGPEVPVEHMGDVVKAIVTLISK